MKEKSFEMKNSYPNVYTLFGMLARLRKYYVKRKFFTSFPVSLIRSPVFPSPLGNSSPPREREINPH